MLVFNDTEEKSVEKVIAALDNIVTLEVLQPPHSPAMIFPGLEIRQSQHRVLQGGEDINLTRLEYSTLVFLASNPGIVLTQEQIFEAVWNMDSDSCHNSLTSFMAFPERGSGGSSQWRGNCSPEVVSSVLRYVLDTKRYYGKDTSQFTLLDPMSGSGTSKAAADRLGVRSILYDLNPAPSAGMCGWNALKNDVEDSADLIFFHPPYHNIIQYSGNMWGKPHPDDLSRCENYNDFLEKLKMVWMQRHPERRTI